MKKKKFKKLVKRENRSFGIVTETIMMNELKKLNENEWRYCKSYKGNYSFSHFLIYFVFFLKVLVSLITIILNNYSVFTTGHITD
jgi:hypothetical protein